MGWTFVWLMIGLKVPIAALLYIVHWAIKQTDDDEPVRDGEGGVRPPHRPRVPRHPRRRGPHGSPGAAPPQPRTRSPLTARARAGHHPGPRPGEPASGGHVAASGTPGHR